MITVTTPWAFRQWAASAKTGDACAYHTGLLMRDRFKDMGGKLARPVHDLAEEAMGLYERGEIALLQRRIVPESSCEYIAVRRTRKNKSDE